MSTPKKHNLKKYKLDGHEAGHVEINEELATAEANGQMIKDYIVALRANARQWSANTKGRSEVVHTTRKPHPQKGGGRSRQGSLVAPQYRGGGRVFGPKPKFDQHVRINKKERQAAIRCLIGEKIRKNRVHVIETTALEGPKTKAVGDLLKALNLTSKRVLFLGESTYADVTVDNDTKKITVHSDQHANFVKSMRNIPKTDFSLASNVNGYDVIVAHDIVVTESALQELSQWLC